MIDVRLSDARGSSHGVKVTPAGQLVVGPVAFDETSFAELATDDVPQNLYGPKDGYNFVITGIRAKANRNVSGTVDAILTIYEGSGPAAVYSATDDKILHKEAMVKGESITITGVNILVSKGVWVNASVTDDDIYLTIFGYYVAGLP